MGRELEKRLRLVTLIALRQSVSLDYSPNPKITLASHTQKTVCFSGKLPVCLFGKALSDFYRTS